MLKFIGVPSGIVILSIVGNWYYRWNYGPADSVGRLCHQIARDFHWDHSDSTPPDGSWYHLSLVALDAFIDECRFVYADTDVSQRDVLKPLLGKPLDEAVLKPSCHLSGYEEKRKRAVQDARAQVTPKEIYDETFAEKLKAKVRDVVMGHINATDLQEPTWLYKKLLPDEKGELLSLIDYQVRFPRIHGGVTKMDWPRTVEPSHIRHALQHGRVSHFDATRILPAEVFNVTIADLARIQGKDTPVQVRGSPSYMCSVRMWWLSYFRIVPHAEWIFCPPPQTLDTFKRGENGKISLRRMSNFIDLDAKILKGSQLEEDVQRSEGQLWFGATMGGLHWDETDNFIVCLSGSMVAMLVSPNYTDAFHGGKSVPFDQYGSIDASHVPSYIVALRPGEGIVIPSRTYHTIAATEDRISFSTFLEPKWDRMKWSSAPGSFQHFETDERRAIRNILMRTASRLWDNRGIAMFQQEAIEIL